MTKLVDDSELVELLGMAIYTDTYTQYGTCSPHRWKQTSEQQREFCRSQIRAALERLDPYLLAKGWKQG